MEKKVIVTIELPNTQNWSDWDRKTEKQVLKELAEDIRGSMLDMCIVDEIGKVKAVVED